MAATASTEARKRESFRRGMDLPRESWLRAERREETRRRIQRRDAENAEISAEKTENRVAGGSKIHALARTARRGSGARGRKHRANSGKNSTRQAPVLQCLLCAYLCALCVSALNSSSRAPKKPLEELARPAADFVERDIQGLLVEVSRSPALDQSGEHLKLGLRGGQAALGVSGGEALSVIQGAIEGGCVAQKVGVLGRQVSHLLDDFDAFRGVQHLVKNPRAAEAQIHQGEVDIIIAPHAGLEGIAGALLALQAGAHLAEFVARAHALAVAPPVHVLKLVQKHGGTLQIAGQGTRFHVGDAFPSLRLRGEVGLVGALRLHQVAGAKAEAWEGIAY